MASADEPSLLGAFSGYVTAPNPPPPLVSSFPVHKDAAADAVMGPLGAQLRGAIETVAANWAASCTGITITDDEIAEMELMRSRGLKAVVDMARGEALRRLRPPPPVALHREEIVPPDAQARPGPTPLLRFTAGHTAPSFRAFSSVAHLHTELRFSDCAEHRFHCRGGVPCGRVWARSTTLPRHSLALQPLARSLAQAGSSYVHDGLLMQELTWANSTGPPRQPC
jgi:hypothetical protein